MLHHCDQIMLKPNGLLSYTVAVEANQIKRSVVLHSPSSDLYTWLKIETKIDCYHVPIGWNILKHKAKIMLKG